VREPRVLLLLLWLSWPFFLKKKHKLKKKNGKRNIILYGTSKRWLNWTAEGFSRRLRHSGIVSLMDSETVESAHMSEGTIVSPMYGNSLYIRPASSPATKAPMYDPYKDTRIGKNT
jgi:hypothetical protein